MHWHRRRKTYLENFLYAIHASFADLGMNIRLPLQEKMGPETVGASELPAPAAFAAYV